ncbi:hypothetical protein [Desulfonatronovibrio magnus]|uniref:hypothetical protein n=1 Tax=Desulfonatronovibrio magnus TaxID=698827 RepID=UPI0012F802AE|nr:hypothetical protein [Desulfonatronovibrio magnus]
MEEILAANSPWSTDRNMFLFEEVPWAFARALDENLDDGVHNLGSIRATNVGDPTAAAPYDGTQELVDLYILL